MILARANPDAFSNAPSNFGALARAQICQSDIHEDHLCVTQTILARAKAIDVLSEVLLRDNNIEKSAEF
ncbi:hypothetical protein C5615_35975 [Burkholderia cepacia]|uniref:Uncharacterized protein n=1 Tax=Burkholderia cepacia TaxID=292 RepID=A0A2S8I1U4_BURCE|nr:hypothetical protein C5615_35975 [Burkholderia cepacia]